MRSMTGYGKGIAEIDGSKTTIELKSVNHRFLDLNIKLPRIFGFAEDRIRNYLKNYFTRGHFDVFVNFEAGINEENVIDLNLNAVEAYVKFADEIHKKYKVVNNLSVEGLFKQKDVIIEKESPINELLILKLIDSALTKASENLIQMRENEGRSIFENLLLKLDVLSEAIIEIEKFYPIQLENYKTRLTGKLKEVLSDSKIDENRLLTEVTIYADKVATDEETTRLNAHINHFKEIIANNDTIGRQLDFIVQEMHREANTISSKCNDLKMSGYVLVLKTEIEKIREQVQNIE